MISRDLLHLSYFLPYGIIMADPTQIHQVIINMCTNATHAMEESGGILEISLDNVELNEKLSAEYLRANIGPYVQLTISDTGCGIDDDEAMVKMGQQILERLGYQVKSRTNPIEALEQFRSNPNQFDLIITDMTMPQMTGDKVAKEILKLRPNIPIIICTGFSEKISQESAGEIGIRKYLEKPLNKRELSIVIREVLDEQY